MKKITILFALAAITSCNNASTNNAANAAKKDTTAVVAKPVETPAPPEDSAAEEKRMTEATMPGPMHKILATFAGKWDVDHTFYKDENSQGEKSTLTCENKMILGGRYLQITETGHFKDTPYNCIDMLGYDNTKKKFVFTQEDDMFTSIIYMEGDYDSTTKVITLNGKYEDSRGSFMLRQTYRIIDDKHAEIDWYGTQQDGKETKIIVSKLTKR